MHKIFGDRLEDRPFNIFLLSIPILFLVWMFLSSYGPTARWIYLEEWERENRLSNLSKVTKIVEKCLSLNARYTPQNTYGVEVWEGVATRRLTGEAIVRVKFKHYNDEPRYASYCKAYIGSSVLQYEFFVKDSFVAGASQSGEIRQVYDYRFCDDLYPAGRVNECPN